MIADPGVDVMVSIVSLWEISVKWRVSKLKFSGTALLDDLAGEGIEPIPVLAEHIVALDSIGFHHRDPFDHLLLAQAKVEKAAIITSDGEMPLYGVPCFPAGC
jgi:PIN domain nuclease of toxin-antitoxin system